MKRFSFRDANGVQHVVGVYGAERIADLERAAETTRAEHAAALGLAIARIRELEGERDELLVLLHRYVDGLPPQKPTSLDRDTQDFLARIEKATNDHHR